MPHRRQSMSDKAEAVISCEDVGSLIELLRHDGFEVIAPTVRSGAITLQPIQSDADLARGYSDSQSPGAYRLEQTGSALFRHAVGPHSPKDFLRSAVLKLYSIQANGREIRIDSPPASAARPIAFLGLRACDLHALRRLTQVLSGQQFKDPEFTERHARDFIIAVDCVAPSANCFCDAMGTGPTPASGFDLRLTEVAGAEPQHFAVTVGSVRGRKLLERVPHRPAGSEGGCVPRLDSNFDTTGLRKALTAAIDDDHWAAVASRCFACGNCTQVCPTCFCTTVEDSSSLDGSTAERWRKTDSCFTTSFSYIHGGSVRSSVSSRYRQWILHKFVYWHDQFGAAGCVGCGRCVTWCPAGIDLRKEIAEIRAHARH